MIPKIHATTRFSVFLQLRRDTIDRIVKHDPVLAFEFLRSTRPTFESDQYQLQDSERQLELRLAGKIAAKNPQLALKLGQGIIGKRFFWLSLVSAVSTTEG